MTGRTDTGPAGHPGTGLHGRRDGHVVVVGGGAAGHAAVERLRERGFTGRITVIGEERYRPYNRTPLSKQLLTGEYTVADLALPSFTDLDAVWRLGTRAVALDLRERVLTLPGAERMSYDGLVIATGVEARVLPGAPLFSDRVHLLRSLDDAHAIDQALGHASQRVVVVGGGFIGCELASTCRARGLDVTIVDVSPTLLTRALGTVLGAVAGDLHRDAGVRLHLGTGVRDWEPHSTGVRLNLEDGETIDADTVVVGIGTVPRVDWLAGSGLDCTDGVLTTATCHVIGADGAPVDGVVAAGDVARWPNRLFDDEPRRVEHWINAIQMGQAAADNLLTGPTSGRPYTPVPRFWSEQHGVKIQSVGMPALGPHIRIVEGSHTKRHFVATHTRPVPDGELLVGLVSFDDPRRLMAYTPLIGSVVKAAGTAPAAA